MDSQKPRSWRTLCGILALFAVAGCAHPRADVAAQPDAAPPTVNAARDATDCDAASLHVASPEWREQIIYMVFIDRFEDGDAANNDFGFGEYRRGSPSHFNGGDIAGITDRLDYIEGLGATTVWVSPPVENQIWSSVYEMAGWHGYWASDFSRIDPHFGTIDDYQRLSRHLHCRDMYLVQDIVVNHTGNYFGYDGPYDPQDTAKNFTLLEEGKPYGDRPSQSPFDLIDRRNADHAAADIYHWTPPITDYDDPVQAMTYQLGQLADVNTGNPVVVEAFKDIYGRWIREVGVDGFRVDTARYVEQDFWHAFLAGDGGVYDAARETGRDGFIAFGETFKASQPMEADGEAFIAEYFGTEARPGFNAMLGFPFYFSSIRVFGNGAPTSEMAFRLEAMVSDLPNPFENPIFIDNHDTARFLMQGSRAGFEQALLTMFTVPGIPVIYQGTEQALKESRQTMFAGGFATESDQFDTATHDYRLVADLSHLRRSNRVFTHGDLSVLAAESSGPGVLAYARSLGDERAIVLLNTASHSVLSPAFATGLPAGTVLQGTGRWAPEQPLVVARDGTLATVLPAHAAWVLMPDGASPAIPEQQIVDIAFDADIAGSLQTGDFSISGSHAPPNARLLVLTNNDFDRARAIRSDGAGRWRAPIAVTNLGRETMTLQVYAPDAGRLSPKISFETQVDEPQLVGAIADPRGDDRGPTGRYRPMQHGANGAQKDLLGVSARAAGSNLELTLTMAEVTDAWMPVNGFDNLMLSVFFDLPGRAGTRILPQINATLPEGEEWDISHVSTGWASSTYAAAGADRHDRGDTLGVAPQATADKATGTIRLVYRGAELAIDDWAGTKIYVTTWDSTQEAGYADITPEGGDWAIGGGPPDAVKILDDARLVIPAE